MEVWLNDLCLSRSADIYVTKIWMNLIYRLSEYGAE